MNVAEMLEAELGPEPSAKRVNSNGRRAANDSSVFDLANGVDTVALLDRLSIEHVETPRGVMATCPGCGEEGSILGHNGGLKCLYGRCSTAGPAGFKGFRTNVDLTALVRDCNAMESAKLICEWFNIVIPASNAKEAPKDDYDHTDSDDPKAPPAEKEAQKKQSVLDRWIDLGDVLEYVTEAPAPQTWLLNQWHDGRDHGVFPRGKTGLLTATGGVGKTYALVQAALAVASGGFLLDTFRVTEVGHVLLALGEEDADEVRRRLWRTLNAEQMPMAQRKEIAARIHILPLHGVPIALTSSPTPGVFTETDFAAALREKLNGFGVDWSLVILDPLSRWAGGGVEANNEAATRFVQVVETIAGVRGLPAVLVAHHSSQNSAQSGKSDARGVTGIRDGFRWQASMDAVTSEDGTVDGVVLTNPKSNYSRRFRPILLARNTEPGIEGTLRVATESEAEALRALLPRDRQTAEQRDEGKTAAKSAKFQKECEAVLSCLPEAPAFISRGELFGAVGRIGGPSNAHTLDPKIAHLMKEGQMLDLSDGGKGCARQYCRPAS